MIFLCIVMLCFFARAGGARRGQNYMLCIILVSYYILNLFIIFYNIVLMTCWVNVHLNFKISEKSHDATPELHVIYNLSLALYSKLIYNFLKHSSDNMLSNRPYIREKLRSNVLIYYINIIVGKKGKWEWAWIWCLSIIHHQSYICCENQR